MNIFKTVNFLNANSKVKFLFIFFLIFNLNTYGQNLTSGGTIGYNASICPGETPPEIVNLTYPSGGNSDPIEYLWMTTTNPSLSFTNWNIAPGTNDEESYSPPPTGITTYYIRCARREGFTNYTGESGIVSVFVKTNPTANINDNPGTSLVGSTIDFSASTSFNSTFSWDFDEDGIIDCVGQDCSHTFSSPGTFTISLTVDNGSCSVTTFEEITIEAINALPVELVSFEALLNEPKEEVTLKWTTASELNNSHFELQRSLDGSRFDYLNVIVGQGNSNQFHTYSFVDKNPVPGVNYYRLKQVDFDGTQTYSNIVSVKISTGSVISSVIPNPVNDRAIVRFGEKLPERTKLQVLSSMGQVLATYHVEDKFSQEINLDRFEKGFYFLRIKNAEKREKAFFKIVKF
ncbi:MAG: PKD domain-containing protein [Saprospiraceae bacterium]